MFTVEQIKSAHNKVKSGVYFPAYIMDIKQLGVTYYETFVSDGQNNYFGTHEYKTSTTAKYDALLIADFSNMEHFKIDIKAHQQGKADYPTFCNDCANTELEKSTVGWKDDLQLLR